jgi:hypothetical protein
MVPALRAAFNDAFTPEKYEAFLQDLHSHYPGAIEFRIAETPVFVPASFARQLTDACEYIIDVIMDPEFKQLTERAIPDSDRVAGENGHSQFLVFDFGVCTDESGNWQPQLIELQGFPSLYGFQVLYPDIFRQHFAIPENYSQYLNGYNKETYLGALRDTIVGSHSSEEVVLLELRPHEQKTRIDFYCTHDYLGIPVVDLLELIQEGKKLYYINARTGKKTLIKRIYNRVIFDELNAAGIAPGTYANIREDLDVEWVAHPNWFYRISKFLLPYLHHPCVPPSFFLNEIKQPPADLQNYVLKPLFSFAGQGVVIDVTPQDIEKIADPDNWILQRKVNYADLIPTPDIPAKVEIRVMYLWKDGQARPAQAINLARLSKGKMIGVRYNKDKEWVGGSVCFFEQSRE